MIKIKILFAFSFLLPSLALSVCEVKKVKGKPHWARITFPDKRTVTVVNYSSQNDAIEASANQIFKAKPESSGFYERLRDVVSTDKERFYPSSYYTSRIQTTLGLNANKEALAQFRGDFSAISKSESLATDSGPLKAADLDEKFMRLGFLVDEKFLDFGYDEVAKNFAKFKSSHSEGVRLQADEDFSAIESFKKNFDKSKQEKLRQDAFLLSVGPLLYSLKKNAIDAKKVSFVGTLDGIDEEAERQKVDPQVLREAKKEEIITAVLALPGNPTFIAMNPSLEAPERLRQKCLDMGKSSSSKSRSKKSEQ